MACPRGMVAHSFNQTNPRALAFARDRSAELVTNIRDDARLAIRQLVGRAFEDGIAPKPLARMIRDVVGLTPRDALAVERRYVMAVKRGVAPDVASRSASAYADRLHRRRALTIARTETMLAANQGQQELWQQAIDSGALKPRGLKKEWIATGDELTCDICGPMDNQRVAIDQSFDVDGPPAHPNCLVDAKTPVYTSDGWKPIGSIEVGSTVLTHTGKFKAVTQIHRNKSDAPTVAIYGHNRRHRLSVTQEHPLLINGRWTKADSVSVGDHVAMLTRRCSRCDRKIPVDDTEYCGNGCATQAGKKWLKAHAEVRRRVLDGVFVLQQPETKIAANRALGRMHASGTWLERKMVWALGELGLKPLRNHPIPRLELDAHGRRRNWFVDLAFPDIKLAVECDGEQWHQDVARDAMRQAQIEAQGWTVLRFSGAQILQDVMPCAETVARVAHNHSGEYEFGCFEVVDVQTIARRQPYPTYNLSVEEDESYIASGFVVHNCRCTVGLVRVD